jgi:signal transduction histidine kinase
MAKRAEIEDVVDQFGDFLLANQHEITRRWVALIERSPSLPTSDDLTYRQVLDHLPALSIELASLLKQPDGQQIRRQATRDAVAHGRKRWEQGYHLTELLREICLIRREFISTWLDAYAEENTSFSGPARNRACEIVENFFDDLIVKSTAQFVEEQMEAMTRIEAELASEKVATARAKSDFLRHVSHELREPLGAIVFAAELLAAEESLAPRAKQTARVILRNAELEAKHVQELLLAAQLAESREASSKR